MDSKRHEHDGPKWYPPATYRANCVIEFWATHESTRHAPSLRESSTETIDGPREIGQSGPGIDMPVGRSQDTVSSFNSNENGGRIAEATEGARAPRAVLFGNSFIYAQTWSPADESVIPFLRRRAFLVVGEQVGIRATLHRRAEKRRSRESSRNPTTARVRISFDPTSKPCIVLDAPERSGWARATSRRANAKNSLQASCPAPSTTLCDSGNYDHGRRK
jgi:hypothetical protein